MNYRPESPERDADLQRAKHCQLTRAAMLFHWPANCQLALVIAILR